MALPAAPAPAQPPESCWSCPALGSVPRAWEHRCPLVPRGVCRDLRVCLWSAAVTHDASLRLAAGGMMDLTRGHCSGRGLDPMTGVLVRERPEAEGRPRDVGTETQGDRHREETVRQREIHRDTETHRDRESRKRQRLREIERDRDRDREIEIETKTEIEVER